jgi:hypothetical protein
MIVFTIFCFLVDEKIKLKVFSLHAPLKLLTNFGNSSSKSANHFKEPKAQIWTLKMHTRSRLRFCQIIPEAAFDKLIVAHFPCSQRRVQH